jgi:hypothetical protein
MKYKKALLITCGVLFFITALTFYLNRVIFPQLIKKIAVERIQEAIKRRVEIGDIRFNWFKGFIIDKVKIYELDPKDAVFAQADQVSFGIVFFPGFKHSRISIPFINVLSPSVRLVHTGPDTWNFSDLSPAPAPAGTAKTAAAPAQPRQTPGLEIAWGGITVSDGKLLIEDASSERKWKEYFDNIALKLTLSYKQINYDFTADIPEKKGLVGATVNYQPASQDTQAQIRLRNIDTAPYLALVNIPDIHIHSGVITDVRLNISHTREVTSAEGDVSLKDFDIARLDQAFKGDIEIRHLNSQYRNGNITARGQIALNNMETKVPGLSAGGSVQTHVNDFELDNDKVTFSGSVHAQNVFLSLKDRRVQVQDAALDNIKVKKDTDGIQSVGSIGTKGLFVQWPDQNLQGDFSLKDLTMRMKDFNDISLEGSMRGDNVTAGTGDKHFSSRHIVFDNTKLRIVEQKNITLSGDLSLDEVVLTPVKNMLLSASVKTDRFSFELDDDTVKISTTLNTSKGRLVLDGEKVIEADPQLELTLQMPLKAPQSAVYKGSVTLSGAGITGFAPIQSLSHIDLDADFENDKATINALGAEILDTSVRATGTVMNFKAPVLNIVAETEELNLEKIKDLAPKFVDQYGLELAGTGSVKLKFEGPASDWLSGKILAVASVKNASAYSSKFRQRLKDVTGIVEATPDSLKLRDFTAVYLGTKYNLSGSLANFKNPKITAELDGPGLALKADAAKMGDVITVNALNGKYLNAVFDGQGTVTLAADGPEFDVNGHASLLLENLVKFLPAQQQKSLKALNPAGMINVSAGIKGKAMDWKNYQVNGSLTSPAVTLMGYKLTDVKIAADQGQGKVKNLTLDGKLYDGAVHAVGSLDLYGKGLPYELALNIDSTDLHKLKMDSPLKSEQIEGKFYLTTMSHGTVADFKNKLQATGSLAIRDGFLAEFNLFKGLLSILNDAMRLGQVMITDVESNFTVQDQKINTENLRLQGPTIVLLGKGWVNFDQICDLDVTVDLSSGVVPPIAHDVLSTLDIRIYDKIADPKFKKTISMPQVINTLIKNLLQ